MNTLKCPACSTVIEHSVDRCPFCQLDGLNQIFLSRESYDTWIQTVVKPHIVAVPSRVFAGEKFGLILTASGNLYGVGDNSYEQISKNGVSFFSEPHPIARNVISAAAACRNTIYITRDGKSHLLGLGARNFTGFSNAKEVYGDLQNDRLLIVRQNGIVFAIGNNEDEQLEPQRIILEKKLPVLRGYSPWKYGYTSWFNSDYWTEKTTFKLEEDACFHVIKKTEDYQALSRQYGSRSIEIHLNPVQGARAQAMRGVFFAGQMIYLEFEPIIRVTNKQVFQPFPHRPDWISDLRHQCGCRPFLQDEYTPEIARAPGIKKVSGFMSIGRWKLYLQADGTVTKSNGEKLEFPNQPVADLSMGSDMLMMSCKNGDVFWYISRDHILHGGTRIPANQLHTL